MFAVALNEDSYVTAFETVTFKQFNEKYRGLPNWMFVSPRSFWSDDELAEFLINPTFYYKDKDGNLFRDYTK